MLTNGYAGGEHTVFTRTNAPFKEFKKLREKSKEQIQEFTVLRATAKIKAIQQSDGVRRSFFHH